MKYFTHPAILLFIALSWPHISWAKNEFINHFEMSMGKNFLIADKITAYYSGNKNFHDSAGEIELNSINNKLNLLIKTSPKDSRLYFLKGLNASLLASLYNKKNKTKFKQLLQEKNQAYKKSMQLDHADNQLSAAIYAVMKRGLSKNKRIEALQQELKLGGSGENESQYWYLHWNNINSLQQAGRLNEANQALKNMQQELKEHNLSSSNYKIIVSHAKKSLEKAIKKKEQYKTQKTKNQRTKKKNMDFRTLILTLISITSILILIGIAFYEIRKKKNHRQRKIKSP